MTVRSKCDNFRKILKTNGFEVETNSNEDITSEEEFSMMAHILDCMVSLGNIHRGRFNECIGQPLSANQQKSTNRIFKAAVITAVNRFVVIDEETY